MNKTPIKKAQLGLVSAALFQFTDEKDDGDTGRLSVALQRRYFDRHEDEWKGYACYLTPETVSAAMACLRVIERELLALGGGRDVEPGLSDDVPF